MVLATGKYLLESRNGCQYHRVYTSYLIIEQPVLPYIEDKLDHCTSHSVACIMINNKATPVCLCA